MGLADPTSFHFQHTVPRNVEQKCVGLDHMYVFAAGEFSSRALSLDWNSSFSESLDRHNRFSPFPFSTFAFGFFFHLASFLTDITFIKLDLPFH